jgi:hypothetical protein
VRTSEQSQTFKAAVQQFQSLSLEERTNGQMHAYLRGIGFAKDEDIEAAIKEIEAFVQNEEQALEDLFAEPAAEQPTPTTLDGVGTSGASVTPQSGSQPVPQTNPVANGLIWPDANGEFPTPFDGALWMASFGIPQTPLRPGTKDAFLPNFPALATTDPATIRKWAADYPGCNFGSVSIEGRTFSFEVDSTDVNERFTNQGGTFTSKLIIQSSPNKGHRYYLSVDGLANIQQAFSKHGDFSLRVKNQYCVSPGSMHPATKQQYRVFFHDLANGLTPPKEQEIAFWNSERLDPKELKKEIPRDLKTGLVSHGHIHGFMLSEAGKLRHLGYDLDIIEPALLQTVHKNCQPPIADDLVRKMAHSICKYKAGTPMDVILNQLADLSDEEEETFEEEKRKVYPECPIFPGVLTDLAKAIYPSLPLEFKMWGLITRWGLMRSGIDKLVFEEHIQPRFFTLFVCVPNTGKTGAINESRNEMDGLAVRVESEYARLNNIKPTPRICAAVSNVASVDSGQWLATEFCEVAKKARGDFANNVCLDQGAKILIDADELKDVFDKGRSTTNRSATIFSEMLKLHSGNRTGNNTVKKGKQSTDNAHLALVVGTTIANYPNLWVGIGSDADGLGSRVNLITTNNPPVPPAPLRTDVVEQAKAIARLVRLAMLPGQTVAVSEEAGRMLDDWWRSIDNAKKSAIRILELIKQLLIVLAVTNAPEDHKGTTLTVGPDLMAPAIEYGKYEIAIREELNPGDSYSHVQSMENAIIKWFQENSSRSEPKTRNDARRGIHPQRKPGGLGTFKMAWDNCANTGVLKLRLKSQRAGLYSL